MKRVQELDLSFPKLTEEQRIKMIASNEENREKARAAAARQYKKCIEKEEQIRNAKKEEQIKNSNVAFSSTSTTTSLFLRDSLTEKATTKAHVHPANRKRRVDSPVTFPVKKRFRCARLVWHDDVSDKPSFEDTHVERVVSYPPSDLASDAFRDGVIIVRQGDSFVASGHAHDMSEWNDTTKWSNLAANLHCVADKHDKIKLVSNGGTGMELVGSGTYNVVVTPPKTTGPDWDCGDVVYRITRPDFKASNNEYSYTTLKKTAKEAYNSMFAAINDVGASIYAIVGFTAPKPGRTLRYGTVYVVEKATCDLSTGMKTMQTEESGVIMGNHLVELIYSASCCGIAFFDIKPGNILLIKDDNAKGGYKFRLADHDPDFFVISKQCWKSLMLLNLAIILPHTRNYPHTCLQSRKGFLSSVEPLVRQLLERRESYASQWLFDVRCLRMPFVIPENVESIFCFQKMLCIMSDSYFYGKHLEKGAIASTMFPWCFDDQSELEEYWRTPKHRNSWPLWKRKTFKPLVIQLLEFALEKSFNIV